MYGAILGDMIGAPYEFDRGNKTKDFPLFGKGSRFTDDTVMTIAVAEALLDTLGRPDEAVSEPLASLQMTYDPSLRVTAEGRLIGGCIDCIAKLIGTPYDGTADFIRRYRDIIWYFDVFEMSAEELYRTMLQMKYCGYFDNTRAVVFGRVMFPGDSTDWNYIEHLRRVFRVPMLWNTDIGHVKPCMTLINGASARITSAEGKGSIEMRLE